MRTLVNILASIVSVIAVGVIIHMYWGDFIATFSQDNALYSIYIGNAAVEVTVADSDAERVKGLSGVEHLDPRQGKLFIFDMDAKPGIWMKDMKFPLDIVWVNRDFKVVHIEENVSPDTYPQVFYPPDDARFVLEVNAQFVNTFKIKEGDTMELPASLIPQDIRQTLRS